MTSAAPSPPMRSTAYPTSDAAWVAPPGDVGTPAQAERDGLADLGPDGIDGIQRGHRLLKDHRHIPPANLPYLLFARSDQFQCPAIGKA